MISSINSEELSLTQDDTQGAFAHFQTMHLDSIDKTVLFKILSYLPSKAIIRMMFISKALHAYIQKDSAFSQGMLSRHFGIGTSVRTTYSSVAKNIFAHFSKAQYALYEVFHHLSFSEIKAYLETGEFDARDLILVQKEDDPNMQDILYFLSSPEYSSLRFQWSPIYLWLKRQDKQRLLPLINEAINQQNNLNASEKQQIQLALMCIVGDAEDIDLNSLEQNGAIHLQLMRLAAHHKNLSTLEMIGSLGNKVEYAVRVMTIDPQKFCQIQFEKIELSNEQCLDLLQAVVFSEIKDISCHRQILEYIAKREDVTADSIRSLRGFMWIPRVLPYDLLVQFIDVLKNKGEVVDELRNLAWIMGSSDLDKVKKYQNNFNPTITPAFLDQELRAMLQLTHQLSDRRSNVQLNRGMRMALSAFPAIFNFLAEKIEGYRPEYPGISQGNLYQFFRVNYNDIQALFNFLDLIDHTDRTIQATWALSTDNLDALKYIHENHGDILEKLELSTQVGTKTLEYLLKTCNYDPYRTYQVNLGGDYNFNLATLILCINDPNQYLILFEYCGETLFTQYHEKSLKQFRSSTYRDSFLACGKQLLNTQSKPIHESIAAIIHHEQHSGLYRFFSKNNQTMNDELGQAQIKGAKALYDCAKKHIGDMPMGDFVIEFIRITINRAITQGTYNTVSQENDRVRECKY